MIEAEDYDTNSELSIAFVGAWLSGWGWVSDCVQAVNKAHGWHEPNRHDAIHVALIHSEVSELLEGLRHGNPLSEHIPGYSAAEEELADVVIRIMHLAQDRGWDVPSAVVAKIEFNNSRPYRHGKEF